MLQNKVALVTGGSKGIGKAIVEKFAKLGSNVIAVSRHVADFSYIEKSIQEKIEPVCCDICDDKAIKDLIVHVNKKYGHLDILVNNAGIMQNALLGMITRLSIQEQFETNVFAMIQLTQMASKIMRRQNYGSIINMASIIGTKGYAGQTVYSATKGAVISFTLSTGTVSKALACLSVILPAITPS